MDSNLITPPDILNNELHSVTLIDPEQIEVDAFIRYCQYSETAYNLYVYTPNMDNLEWLQRAVDASNAVIVNTRSDNYKDFCLLDKTYYYGPKNFVENHKKLQDPIHYFATQVTTDK